MLGSVGLNPVAVVGFWCSLCFGKRRKGGRQERKGKKERKNKINKVRKKERKETSEMSEAHSSEAGLCLLSFLPTSVVDDPEPAGRKETKRERRKRGTPYLQGLWGCCCVCTTLSATDALSTSLHTEKKQQHQKLPWPRQNKILPVLEWPVLWSIAMTLLLIYGFLPETVQGVIKCFFFFSF